MENITAAVEDLKRLREIWDQGFSSSNKHKMIGLKTWEPVIDEILFRLDINKVGTFADIMNAANGVNGEKVLEHLTNELNAIRVKRQFDEEKVRKDVSAFFGEVEGESYANTLKEDWLDYNDYFDEVLAKIQTYLYMDNHNSTNEDFDEQPRYEDQGKFKMKKINVEKVRKYAHFYEGSGVTDEDIIKAVRTAQWGYLNNRVSNKIVLRHLINEIANQWISDRKDRTAYRKTACNSLGLKERSLTQKDLNSIVWFEREHPEGIQL